MGRIKSLDGIRAISILMVLFGHASATMPKVQYTEYFFPFIFNANLGVKIFFVISGYLITKLLIVEREKTGRIDIKDFYLRRIFRIFPVFYLYILVILFLKFTFFPDIFTDYGIFLAAAFYCWNYKHLMFNGPPQDNGYWYFGHLWSLSMEEQFYLAWPLMFVKINRDKLLKVVLALVILMPLVRIATYFLMPDSRGQLGMMLHTGGDTILFGCLGALIEKNERIKAILFKYLNKTALVAVVAILVFVVSPILNMKFKGSYQMVLGESFNAICITFLLFWCIYIPSKVANFLNYKFIAQIGILSYSLYIWQQLILTTNTNLWINKFPQNLGVVFVIALVSYYMIEKPILKLKKRLKKV
ncbi:acyltransferase [Flavobacterium zepuense]|uniref:Acyltransferase n=1 Tax=Flavobacterium zepuense TaxID=2593302 RepID=A0A552UXT5_9FLAO|nr:acyltransferase [Flavobacterium zepuense]TRW23034.1 acyltransferase [Flavobacterium zepuense]